MAVTEFFNIKGAYATSTAEADAIAKQNIGEFILFIILNSSTGAFSSFYVAGRSPVITPTDITKTITVS